MAQNPSLRPDIGPDGLAREAPVITYTEKMIEQEQLQLKRYIQENYARIRDVEQELENLTREVQQTAGPKKAALELLRKKIETSNERIHIARKREELAREALEEASKAVRDEEEIKQKLCEDLNCLVQESSNSQYARLEELKRRLETLNPNRASGFSNQEWKQTGPAQITAVVDASAPGAGESQAGRTYNTVDLGNNGNVPVKNGQPTGEGEVRGKKNSRIQGRGRGIGVVPIGRRSSEPEWTESGFNH